MYKTNLLGACAAQACELDDLTFTVCHVDVIGGVAEMYRS
jgi:hypothetical protein